MSTFLISQTSCTRLGNTHEDRVIQSQMPALPNGGVGLSGSFAGTHNGVLLVAGGSNFPDGMPWAGGAKKWHDRIFVLRKSKAGSYEWIDKEYRLPAPVAYGVSLSLHTGVLCIGGRDANHCFTNVYLLRWNPATEEVEIIEYPSLPEPLANSTGTIADHSIYVIGGQTTPGVNGVVNFFYSLNAAADNPSWEKKPSCPGPPRILAMSATQTREGSECIYFFGGCNYTPENSMTFLSDVYCYDTKKEVWEKTEELPVPLAGAIAVRYEEDNILVFGGDNGRRTLERIAVKAQIDRLRESDKSERAKHLEKEYIELFETHPGFSPEILEYTISSEKWNSVGKTSPFPVTTTAVWFDGKIVIPGGETSPGRRTSNVLVLEVDATNELRHSPEW